MSIVAQNITKRFGAKVALDKVTLEAPGGALTALLGPSGCGKTTLLRIIAGLEFPDEGQVLFEGEDATDRSAGKRNVGFVFQHYALFRHMSIFENVAFALRVRKRPNEEVEQRVRELLKLVQLEDLGKRFPAQLSGGQRQRVALARALAARPKVLLLDEPFGALDAQVRKELRRWLRKLHDEIHVTTLFVTHDQEEALEVADQVVIFNKDPGRIEQAGTPEDVYNHPKSPFVLQFLGQVNIFHGRIEQGEALVEGAEEDAERKAYVRPHEIDLLPLVNGTPPAAGKRAGIVVWVHRAGATVKVEVELEESKDLVSAEMDQTRYAALKLERGQRVEVATRDARFFPRDYEI
jgi:sulfate transport system ATP-binding protein